MRFPYPTNLADPLHHYLPSPYAPQAATTTEDPRHLRRGAEGFGGTCEEVGQGSAQDQGQAQEGPEVEPRTSRGSFHSGRQPKGAVAVRRMSASREPRIHGSGPPLRPRAKRRNSVNTSRSSTLSQHVCNCPLEQRAKRQQTIVVAYKHLLAGSPFLTTGRLPRVRQQHRIRNEKQTIKTQVQ